MTSSNGPKVIVLRAPGTATAIEETAAAWQLAGARAETWHAGRLSESPGRPISSRF